LVNTAGKFTAWAFLIGGIGENKITPARSSKTKRKIKSEEMNFEF
jgi:hypothetical protein